MRDARKETEPCGIGPVGWQTDNLYTSSMVGYSCIGKLDRFMITQLGDH